MKIIQIVKKYCWHGYGCGLLGWRMTKCQHARVTICYLRYIQIDTPNKNISPIDVVVCYNHIIGKTANWLIISSTFTWDSALSPPFNMHWRWLWIMCIQKLDSIPSRCGDWKGFFDSIDKKLKNVFFFSFSLFFSFCRGVIPWSIAGRSASDACHGMAWHGIE